MTACFRDGADVSRMKLRYLDRFAASEYIEFIQLLLGLCRSIIQHIVRLKNAGANLQQRIFPDKRIRDRLEYICGLRF